jgi:hypothetical protein
MQTSSAASAQSSSLQTILRSTHANGVRLDVTCDEHAVQATIIDGREEVISAFAELTGTQRQRLADDAWFLGLRCVMNAHRLATESRLEDVGQKLATTFETQLVSYQQRQHEAFANVVKDYFDPRDGRVPARIDAFLRDGGDLARTMSKYLAPGGELEKVLARSVGEASPLLRMLSPTESEGVVRLIEAKVRELLATSHADFARALDPDAKTGAMAVFFADLEKRILAANNNRGEQLAAIANAVDANNETSAISRLMRETQQHSRDLLRAVNGDDPSSVLGIIKASLSKQLEVQGQAQLAALQALDERHRKEALETREALARLEERKRSDARSPRGGAVFETALAEEIARLVAGAPMTVDSTGNTVGSVPSSKVGDLVVRYTEESPYVGSALVIEAKHDASYNESRARKELEVARQNRGAVAGLFVLARSHAPAGFPTLRRHGQDVLVIWDENDPGSTAFLQAALILALALAARHQRPQDPGEIKALQKIEGRLTAELKRLEKLRGYADNIRKNADSIAEEVATGMKKMRALMGDAKKTLTALNVELDAADAMEEPIELPMLDAWAAE